MERENENVFNGEKTRRDSKLAEKEIGDTEENVMNEENILQAKCCAHPEEKKDLEKEVAHLLTSP